jgi:copper chaperone CopZ
MEGTMVRASVGGMTCPTCEQSLERAIGRLPGVRSVSADYRAGAVDVELDAGHGQGAEGAIRQAVEDAGYDLEGIGPGRA